MKALMLNYEAKLDGVDIQKATAFLRKNGAFEYIDMLNWPVKYPYKPFCRFKATRSADSLFIYFHISEKNIRAIHDTDQQPVWQDSCVEFFCQHPFEDEYFNFEFNCIGTCLATKRKGRDTDVKPLSASDMKSVKRFASLGDKPFDEQSGYFEWELTVEIPFKLMEINTADIPQTLRGNFYKCGDETSDPHYISWNPVETENPDFHRPDFFGKIILSENLQSNQV